MRSQTERSALGASSGVGAATVPPMSPEFLRRVKRYQAPLHDSDAATAQTVQLMAERVRESAGDPIVKRAAVEAVQQFRGGPSYGMSGRDPFADPLAMAESCWWMAKTGVKFVHHNEHIARWWNEHDQLQLLISPEVLLQMERPEGDCAIFTMLICALLEALGVQWEIVTAAVNPQQPDVFSHVWARVVLPDGRRVPLDASHGAYPGWQVPQERQYKVQVWNESGRPVGDSPVFTGLHGYEMGRGMGTDEWDELGAQIGITQLDPRTVYNPADYPQLQVPTSTAPAFNTAGFLANLANQWTQIGSRVIAPSTTYQRNADGSVSLVTPGNSPVLSSSVLSGGGGSSSLLLYGALGLGALVLVGSMMKGGR